MILSKKILFERAKEESDMLKEIGFRIKNVRLRNNLTQAEFARTLRISTRVLSCIENGKRPPNGKILFALEGYFTINGVWLMTGKGEMITSNQPKEINDYLDLLNMFNRLSGEGKCKIVNVAKILLQGEWSAQQKCTPLNKSEDQNPKEN